MKRICAITMVRNDEFYLRKWVEYYGRELGRENLYIYFDGVDQTVPAFCEGTHVVVCEKLQGNVAQGDKRRIRFLSQRAAELFKDYDLVIGTDADEILVVDNGEIVDRGTHDELIESCDIYREIANIQIDYMEALS
jgi:hypothetical protein